MSKAPLVPYMMFFVVIVLKTLQSVHKSISLWFTEWQHFGSDLKILYTPYCQESGVEKERLEMTETSLVMGSLWNKIQLPFKNIISSEAVPNLDRTLESPGELF